MVKSKSMDMTTGSTPRNIIIFAIPILIGNFFQQMYNMVDTAVLGRFVSADALAAVGTTTPVITLIIGIMIGMSSGISIVLAQKVGEGGRTGGAVANGIWLMLGISVVITVVGLLVAPAVLRLMDVPEELMEDALSYADILFIGTLATAAYNYESGILRAYGNSIVPLVFLIITSLMNVVLDILFVQAFSMGVEGVALATIISQFCSAALCLIYIMKKAPELHVSREDWKPDWAIIRRHIKTGTPVALSQSCLGLSFLVAQTALNSLGAASISAYTSASKMDTLAYMVMGGFATSIATFTAQNYGKKEYERVRKGVRVGLIITVIAALALMGFNYLFGGGFMSLFVGKNEPEIFDMGLRYMHLSALFYLSLCCDFILQQGLVGVGKTIASTLVCVSEIATRIVTTYLLVYRLGFFGMIFVSPCCWTVSSLLLIVIYRPLMKRAGVIA